MFITKKETLEDHIINQLQRGPQKITEIIFEIQKRRKGTTKQGVYRVIRLLKQDEIVVVYRGVVSLNLKWLNELNKFSALAQYHHKKNFSSGIFLNIEEGEKITFSFKNLALTDAFWNQAIYLLLEVVPKNQNWIAYNPHAWFFLARPEDEKALMKKIIEKRQYLLTVGNNMNMDREIIDEFDGEKSQYCMLKKPLFKKDSYYLNIIGDFLIEVYLNNEASKKIKTWYKKTNNKTSEKIKELKRITISAGKTKLTISKNRKKAQKIRKKLQRNFHVISKI